MRNIDKVIAALGSPIRREILGLIWDVELPAGAIADAFEVTAPTISQHLAVLRDSGLVTMTAAGTSRLYRARKEGVAGLHGALEGSLKWTPADEIPERTLAEAHTKHVVVAGVDVDTDQATTYAAFTNSEVYSRWLGVPGTLQDGRFAATMEWGTEVLGRYRLVIPPVLIVLSWDFDDDNVPVPGREMIGLSVGAHSRRWWFARGGSSTRRRWRPGSVHGGCVGARSGAPSCGRGCRLGSAGRSVASASKVKSPGS